MATRSAPVTWNNLRIEYVGELGFDYVLDSKDRKAKIQITNTGTTSVQDIYFQIAIEGVGDYPMITGVTHGTSIKVEIATPYSQWFRIPMAINGDTAQFDTSVVERDDWIVRVTGDGLTSQTSNVTAGQSINFALSSDTGTSPSFSVLSTDDSPVGFWKGAVSESERTFVLIPGQENWAQTSSIAEGTAIREASEIRKYDFNGNMLWSYKP